MDDELNGSGWATDSGIVEWRDFETRLAAYVSTMFDPGDEDELALHVPHPEMAELRIDVSTFGDGTRLHLEWHDGHDELEMHEAAEAARIVRFLAEVDYALPHPDLMTAEARGPAARGIGVLALAAPVAEDAEDDHGDEPVLGWPHDREELLDLVLTHLRSAYGPAVDVDEDGDVPLLVDGVGLWLRVEESAPMLHLFTKVVDGVHSRRQTGVELNVVNRDHRWSRWVRRDREVWQELHVPAHPFVPRVLDSMLEGFAHDHQQVQGDLADRLGGRSAL